MNSLRVHSHGVRRNERAGFTLIEVIVALAVVGIAATIIITLFFSSHSAILLARDESIAATLAEAKLSEIVAMPKNYVWKTGGEVGKEIPVLAPEAKDEKPQPVGIAPATLKEGSPEFMRENNVYKGFTWSAFARVPSATSAHTEVTVVVDWTRAGRTHRVALTSALPRAAVEGLS